MEKGAADVTKTRAQTQSGPESVVQSWLMSGPNIRDRSAKSTQLRRSQDFSCIIKDTIREDIQIITLLRRIYAFVERRLSRWPSISVQIDAFNIFMIYYVPGKCNFNMSINDQPFTNALSFLC